MKSNVKITGLAFFCAAVLLWAGSARSADQQNADADILVGRIAHIEGKLLRYVPEEDDWVLTDEDTPFGEYDSLFSSEDGRAEIIMPNNTMTRIGGDTQVQLLELGSDSTVLDVASGIARLYNKSAGAEIRAATPFGDVHMPPGSVCDVFVHEDQAEMSALKGTVAFVRAGSTERHEVIAGSSSIIATSGLVTASAQSVEGEWDAWNVERDVQWTRRMQARGQSRQYLPESLQDHAYELDSNGRWERVHYDGAYRYFWRPSYVSVGWTPFSAGRWIVWHGEQTWVPCEPFGYVTHHYGNWVYAGSGWYWAPPVSGVMVTAGLPLLHVGFNWYPGRVAWVSSGLSIGWFPLAPYEMYYCRSYWGPWSRVRRYHRYYDCRRYRHYRHARFIDHKRFYGSRNYRHAGLRKMHRDEKFRGRTLVPDNLRKTYKERNRQRFASNMPGIRDRLPKIDARKNIRPGKVVKNRTPVNPFKREKLNRGGNGYSAPTRVVKKTARTDVKKTPAPRFKMETARAHAPKVPRESREQANRTIRAGTGNRPQRSAVQPRSAPSVKSRMKAPANVQQPAAPASGKTGGIGRTTVIRTRTSINRTRTSAARNPAAAKRTGPAGNVSSRRSLSGSQSLSSRPAPSVSPGRSAIGRAGSGSRSLSSRPAASVSPGRSVVGRAGSGSFGFGGRAAQTGRGAGMQGFSGRGGRR